MARFAFPILVRTSRHGRRRNGRLRPREGSNVRQRARVHPQTSTSRRMNTTHAYQRRPLRRPVTIPEKPTEPVEPRPPRSSWVAALVTTFAGAECDEREFLRIEKIWYAGQPVLTTARQQNSALELLGPPPLGI